MAPMLLWKLDEYRICFLLLDVMGAQLYESRRQGLILALKAGFQYTVSEGHIICVFLLI